MKAYRTFPDPRARRLFAAVLSAVVAAPLLWASALVTPLWVDESKMLVVLFGAGLVCELLPVRFRREHVRVALTLPFLAGIAWLAGPLWAVAADMVYAAVGVLCHGRSRRFFRWPEWATNTSLAAAQTGAGALALWLVVQHMGTSLGAGVLAVLLFAIVHTFVNVGIVRIANVDFVATMHWRNWGILPLVPWLVVLLYGATIAATLAAVYIEAAYAVALMLVPAMVLRELVSVQSREFERYDAAIKALATLMQRTHPYTLGHVDRVSVLAEKLAWKLGVSGSKTWLLREAAVLHDLGKVAVDESVLDKQGRLEPHEMAHVRQHAAFGADILSASPAFRAIVPWVRAHHERPDGNGYPDGLTDVEIPLESKIISVVDAFDAMVGGDSPNERRPYQKSLTEEEALAELLDCSGSQFDPRVVGAFVEILSERALLGTGGRS